VVLICYKKSGIKYIFYLYQRPHYRDNYFFKIKSVFFLYLRLSSSWKENDRPLYISDIRQIVGYRTPAFIQPWMVYFKEIKINKMLIAISKKTCYLQLIVIICLTKWMSRHFLTYRRGTNMLQKVRWKTQKIMIP
jgi:hypothetical protein